MSQIQERNLKNLKNQSPELVEIEVVKEKDVLDFDIVCENIINSSQQESASQGREIDPGATNSKKRKRIEWNVEACPIPVLQKRLHNSSKPKKKIRVVSNAYLMGKNHTAFQVKQHSYSSSNYVLSPDIKNNTSNEAGWINSFTPVSSEAVKKSFFNANKGWNGQVSDFLKHLNEPVYTVNEKEIIDSNSQEENGRRDLMRPSFFELVSIENNKKVTKPINDFIEYYIRAKSGYTINVKNFNVIWKLANHNEKTLHKLYQKEQPRYKSQLRLLLAKELEANLQYNQLPQNISIRELLDVTVDYFMRDNEIREQPKLDNYEFTTEYLQSLLDTVKLVDQCKSFTKQLHDYNYAEKKVRFFQRLKTLENLRSFIEFRVSQISKMSPGAYYLSLVAQYILAHVEMSLCSLKRMHRVYGYKCLKEFLEEKISPFMEYIPEEVMSFVPLICDFLLPLNLL